MKNVEVHMPSLNQAFGDLSREGDDLLHAAYPAQEVMNSGLSSIAGVSSAGIIHGLFAVDGPGSAAQALIRFGERIHWIDAALRQWRKLNQQGDSILAAQLDADGLGVKDSGDTFVFDVGPVVDIPPVSFVPPMVFLEQDLAVAAQEISAIDTAQIKATTTFWTTVAHAAQKASRTLTSVMESVAARNSGDFIDEAVSASHELARALDQVSDNATNLAGRTETFDATVSSLKQSAQLLNAVTAHVPVKSVQQAAREKAVEALTSGLQSAVDASLPAPGSLSDPLRDLNIPEVITPNQPTMPDYHAGLEVGDITLPHSIAPEVEDNTHGADAFEMTDGHLRPKGAAELSTDDLNQIDRMVDNHIQGLSHQVGQDITVGDIQTQGAGQILSPGVASGGLSSSSLLQGSVIPPGIAGGNGTSSIGSPGSASLNRFIGGGLGAGTGSIGSGGIGGAGGVGSGSGIGRVLPPASAGPGFGGQAGAGTINNGAGGVGQQGGGGQHGGGAGRTPGMAGGMAPMAGGRASGGGNKQEEDKNPQMNTSEYEQEQNLRALLDPLPPAIPGVIGAWARED